MAFLTILFWIITAVALVISLRKDKKKTIDSISMARGMMGSMFSSIIGILLAIGLILTYVSPETIKTVLGGSNELLATIGAAFAGGITLIPAFVAFPLVASFVDAGASIVPGVAFLTTLTMVGFVTFPLEKKEFGLKFALLRNIFSFIFAIGIALVMGGVM